MEWFHLGLDQFRHLTNVQDAEWNCGLTDDILVTKKQANVWQLWWSSKVTWTFEPLSDEWKADCGPVTDSKDSK